MIYSVVYCASIIIAINNRYYCLFVSIYYYSFRLFVIRLFASFSFEFCFDCCLKRKRAILNLTLFRYFNPVVQEVPVTSTCSTSSSRVNKHHTADSTDFVLVLKAKEPITIIDKGDRRNQYLHTAI